jgi:sugar fermentation stimulation protein A
MIFLPEKAPVVTGIFEARLNRFTVRCTVNGKPVLAYLANPGRLWEILLPGRKLYLQPSPLERKLPYTVLAADINRTPVLLHTPLTNFYVEKWLERHLIPGLEDFSPVKREMKFGSSRFDFLLTGPAGLLALEVKNCTLFARNLAFFPDAVSDRGRRHLLELASFARKPAHLAAILFVVWWPEALFFFPEFHTDWKFTQALLEIKDQIKILAVAAGLNDKLEPEENSLRPLNIPWPLIEEEAIDRGVYILIARAEIKMHIPIGKMGIVEFEPGYYLYAGSARKNLEARLHRHGRRQKKLFWHIDYLLERARLIQIVPIRTGEDLECELARELSQIATPVPGFGCSDCNCQSHLFFLRDDPRKFPPFLEIVHKFRYHRLRKKLLEGSREGDLSSDIF